LFLATIVAAMLVGSALPTTAGAAQPTSPWKLVDVTLHTEDSQAMLLVSGELADDVKLPAQAQLAVPSGVELQWVGEILGGAPENDPELKYVKSTEDGMDIYTFTLTKAREAQVEAMMPGVFGFDGSTYTSALQWKAWTDLPEVVISQRIPANARIVNSAENASVQGNEGGYSLYTKSLSKVKKGDVADLQFSYAVPAGAPTAAPTPQSNAPLFIALGAFALLAAAFAVAIRRKMSARDFGEPDSYDEDAVVSQVGALEEAEQALEEDAPAEPARRSARPVFVVVAVIAALVLGFALASNRGTKAQVLDGKLTKSFGASSPCSSASIPIVANQGVDLSSQGPQLLDAFTGQPEIGVVTLDLSRSVVDITFCESAQTPESIGQILESTGLVTVASNPTSPTAQ
jgi:hypothetical protein